MKKRFARPCLVFGALVALTACSQFQKLIPTFPPSAAANTGLAEAVPGRPSRAPAAAPPTQPSAPPRIWAVVIGTSKHADRSFDLAYATADAVLLNDFLRDTYGANLAKERVTFLVDERATRAGILKALAETFRRAARDDLVIVYVAAHGVPEVDGELYFLAYDSDPNNLIGTAISQAEVERLIQGAPVGKVVLIADACHAGLLGVPLFARRSIRLTETNRLLTEISLAKNGVAILTAARGGEYSQEGAQWGGGHGVFTYWLVAGLKGQADTDANGTVTLRELYDFVYDRVRGSTSEKQHIELMGTFDDRLPLAIMK